MSCTSPAPGSSCRAAKCAINSESGGLEAAARDFDGFFVGWLLGLPLGSCGTGNDAAGPNLTLAG